ncbi:MAG TPA: molecular chaperone TorD family protein [Ideonella sp.]|nr:molecular chaperone TorD family protein [Ideonella sp.]
MNTRPLVFSAPPEGSEELARAEVYGLLAQLFYGPLAADLHEQLRVAVTEAPARGAFLEAAFGELVAAARRLTLAQVQEEYAALFVAIGKPEVFLYGSYYVAGTLNEKPLVALRDELAALGLARGDDVTETEDHIACLCEVMRYLIAGGDGPPADIEVQRRFYERQLRGWVDRLCDALAAHPRADFYRAAGGFARDFFAVEGQAFDLLDT